MRSLEQVNRWLLRYRPTLGWLTRLPLGSSERGHIVDVGCGRGVLLRHISAWARRLGIVVELRGIDLGAYAVRAAMESELGICMGDLRCSVMSTGRHGCVRGAVEVRSGDPEAFR